MIRFTIDNGSIIAQITNKGLYERIANAASTEEKNLLQQSIFYINAARLLLLSLFIGSCILVYIAYKKRLKAGIQQ